MTTPFVPLAAANPAFNPNRIKDNGDGTFSCKMASNPANHDNLDGYVAIMADGSQQWTQTVSAWTRFQKVDLGNGLGLAVFSDPGYPTGSYTVPIAGW